jgi:hypothetical protein
VDVPERDLIEAFALGKTIHADPRVRLEAVVCAGQSSGIDAANAVLAATEKDIDDNLDFAIWQSIRAIDMHYENGSIVAAIESGDAGIVAAVASAGNAEQLGRVAKILLAGEATRSIESLQPLVDRTGVDGNVPTGVGSLLASMITSPEQVDAAVATMATTWKVSQLKPMIAAAIDQADDVDGRDRRRPSGRRHRDR